VLEIEFHIQPVKNNKDDGIALVNHVRETTFKLVNALQAWNDLDSIKPGMEDYYK
jgi:hypothetical protein